MVKGLARRVIVVKPEQDRMFEQAIFILRDDVKAVDEDALVRQACECAKKYVKDSSCRRRRVKIPAPAFAAAGAAVTGVAWLATRLI